MNLIQKSGDAGQDNRIYSSLSEKNGLEHNAQTIRQYPARTQGREQMRAHGIALLFQQAILAGTAIHTSPATPSWIPLGLTVNA